MLLQFDSGQIDFGELQLLVCVCVRLRGGGHRIRDWFRVSGPLNNASSPAAGGLNLS